MLLPKLAVGVVATHQMEGPVSAALTFVHGHSLVLVATLTGRLEAFHVAQHSPTVRQVWFTLHTLMS